MFEYHVITIGRFSRNRFWGELETQSYRGPLCTCTLLKGKDLNIIVDPSQPPAEMVKTLNDRSGLWPGAINAVFLTHAHNDHIEGLELFRDAQWYMGEVELEAMRNSTNPRHKALSAHILPAVPGFLPGVETLLLPGHTDGTTALLVDTVDGKLAIVGDAVMTRDFFKARQGYHNSVDFDAAASSISRLAEIADVVVPGHDNYFLVKGWK
jgi:glyoxylase-like metal-dependent hydrolase (beta-lactamase superfamily II)